MVIKLNEHEIEHILTEYVKEKLEYPTADCFEIGYDQNTEAVYFRFEVSILPKDDEEEEAEDGFPK